tara:strand:- start:2083 stop:2544 length:462 start_codon:yes stop_codon:yes gene_type:complete
MRNQEFIEIRLIEESKKLLEAGFLFPTFSIISQGIETLGAFIDKKPLTAKAQSKKRFSLAVNQLLPEIYKDLNSDNWLYKQMRCNVSHLCSSGAFIDLKFRTETSKKNKHLDLVNDQRLFVIENLLIDFHAACLTVIDRLDKEELKQKAMAIR